ncbi:MAG: membrane protein insertion efficiency factor YidD [Sulfurovaceae bacterium]|nr:membrane protein insertion efficiency factor YidD [Sulfurovaceae bacterium]
MTKKFFTLPIKAYQYISRMTPGNCRYYPTCSEYAKWQFENTNPASAFISSALRILRCNQFFKSGIDYPLITYKPPKLSILKTNINYDYGKMDIKYWIVPKDKKYYYVVKDFNDHRTK